MDRLLTNLEELQKKMEPKKAARYQLKLVERISKRLGGLSDNCEQCSTFLHTLLAQVERLKDKEVLNKDEYKEYSLEIKKITDHLHKEHKLVTEGYYMNLYMSLGLCLGLPFGMVIFDNLALGLPMGLAIGLAIGSGMDEDAKKKGLVI